MEKDKIQVKTAYFIPLTEKNIKFLLRDGNFIIPNGKKEEQANLCKDILILLDQNNLDLKESATLLHKIAEGLEEKRQCLISQIRFPF